MNGVLYGAPLRQVPALPEKIDQGESDYSDKYYIQFTTIWTSEIKKFYGIDDGHGLVFTILLINFLDQYFSISTEFFLYTFNQPFNQCGILPTLCAYKLMCFLE